MKKLLVGLTLLITSLTVSAAVRMYLTEVESGCTTGFVPSLIRYEKLICSNKDYLIKNISVYLTEPEFGCTSGFTPSTIRYGHLTCLNTNSLNNNSKKNIGNDLFYTGKIKWYNAAEGYGFIKRDDNGEDVLFKNDNNAFAEVIFP